MQRNSSPKIIPFYSQTSLQLQTQKEYYINKQPLTHPGGQSQVQFQQSVRFSTQQQQYIQNIQSNMEMLKISQNMCEELVRKIQVFEQENQLLRKQNQEKAYIIKDMKEENEYLKGLLMRKEGYWRDKIVSLEKERDKNQDLLREKNQQFEKDIQKQKEFKQIKDLKQKKLLEDKIGELMNKNKQFQERMSGLVQQLNKSQSKIAKLTRQKQDKIQKSLHNYFKFAKDQENDYKTTIVEQKERNDEQLKKRKGQRQTQNKEHREQNLRNDQLARQVRSLKWKLMQKQEEILYMIRRNRLLQHKFDGKIKDLEIQIQKQKQKQKQRQKQAQVHIQRSELRPALRQKQHKREKQFQRKKQAQQWQDANKRKMQRANKRTDGNFLQKGDQKQRSQTNKRCFKKVLDQDRFYTCQTEPYKLKRF